METSTSAEEPAGDFQVYQLTPLSELAKSFKGPKYGSTLAIAPQGSIRIGRNVRPSEGYCLPARMGTSVQQSLPNILGPGGRRLCRHRHQHKRNLRERGSCSEGGSCPLKPGDLLNLSVAPEQDPSKALEYRFEPQPALKPPSEQQEETPQGRRQAQEKEILPPITHTTPPNKAPAVKRKRAVSPDNFASAEALAQLQKNNQELHRKVEAAREHARNVEVRAEADVANLLIKLTEAYSQAESAFAIEREKAVASTAAATASCKQAMETMKVRVSELEQQVDVYAAESAKLEAVAKDYAAKQERLEKALEQMAQQKEEAESALNNTISELRSSEATLTEELQSYKGKAAAAVFQVSDLQHQLNFEKANISHAEHLRKQAEEDFHNAKTARQHEERLRRAAEEAQASLKRQLDEAIRRNERAEEGRDQALGASAVQQAYLRQVLCITSSLTAARQAEETARTKAAAARNEADKSLAVLQKQVVSALNPDMDAAHVEQYMKEIQSCYEAEEATQRSGECVGALPQGTESQEADHGFDPEATQLEAFPSVMFTAKEQTADMPRQSGDRSSARAAAGTTSPTHNEETTANCRATEEHVNVSLSVFSDEAHNPLVVARLHAKTAEGDNVEALDILDPKEEGVGKDCDKEGQSVSEVDAPREGVQVRSRQSLGTPAEYVPLGSEAPMLSAEGGYGSKEDGGDEEDKDRAISVGSSGGAAEELVIADDDMEEDDEGAEREGGVGKDDGVEQRECDDLDDME